MIASAEVGGGRLNESGVWKNAATESWELVPVSMVQVTGVGTDVLRVQLPLDQTMLDNKHMFSLAWNCTEATDAATGCRYYAQAQAIGDGQYKVRVDCMERMWFWLELHVVM